MLHFECSFCGVVERFATTTSDVVGENHLSDFVSMFDVIVRAGEIWLYPKISPFCVFWDLSVLIFSPG